MFANTLPLVSMIASLLALTAADCPPECQCYVGTNGNEHYCTKQGTILGNGTTDFRIQKESDWASVYCMENLEFSCAEIPKIPLFDSKTLRLLKLVNCRIPTGSLMQILKAFSATGVKEIQFENTPGGAAAGMHADLFEGLNETTALSVFDVRQNSKRLSSNLYDISEYLTSLRILHLEDTNFTLTEPAPGVFTDLRLLTFVGGVIPEIPARSFKGLQVKKLFLQNNQIERIEGDVFEGLEDLEILNLSNNRIKKVSRNQWINLPKVEVLDLFKNRIEEIGSESFVALKKLKWLKLFFNNVAMTFQSRALADIPTLTYLELHWSRISSLPNDLLHGSSAIVNLTLYRNSLTSLPADLFRDQVNLEMLDLSRNKIELINKNNFRNLNKLVTLKLDHNNITYIHSDTFSSLTSLKTLTLHFNHIKTLQNHAFKGLIDLDYLSLNNNELTLKPDTDKYVNPFNLVTPFNALLGLQYLNLSRNYISTVLYQDWCLSMVYLKSLDLSFNRFTSLEIDDLQFSSGYVNVNFDHNNISTINVANQFFIPGENYNPQIYIGNNPLKCDCSLCNLRLMANDTQPKLLLGDTKCASPEVLAGKIFQTVDPRILTCNLDESQCPKHCTCITRCSINTLEIICTSEKYLKEYNPPTEYNIDSIDLTLKVQPSTHFLKNLRDFQLLRYLTLSSLDYKELPYIDTTNLTAIDLSNNSLSYIPINLLSRVNISLARNPIICDCSNKDNINAIKHFKDHIKDYALVSCNEGLVSTINVEQLCNTRDATIIGTAIALLGLLITSMLVLIYNSYLRVILCTKFLHEDELDKDKKYDAFVSFSHADNTFVSEILVPKLEAPPNNFKICIHYRDWLPGDFIPSSIIQSVEQSRRTIIVLSKNYIASTWSILEFRAACDKAMRENRVRLITIILDDVDINTLDDELKHYLENNTYIKWGDFWFWRKLRDALLNKREKKRVNIASKKLADKLDKPPNIVIDDNNKKDNNKGGLYVTLTRDGKMVNIANESNPKIAIDLPKQLSDKNLYEINKKSNFVDFNHFGDINNIIDDYVNTNKNITKDDHFISNQMMKRNRSNEKITKDDSFINEKTSKDIFVFNGLKNVIPNERRNNLYHNGNIKKNGLIIPNLDAIKFANNFASTGIPIQTQ